VKETETIPLLEIGSPVIGVEDTTVAQSPAAVIDITLPLSSFHYQVKHVGTTFTLGCFYLFDEMYSPGDCLIMNIPSTRSLELLFIRLLG
jgi:hypothetical protein